MLWEFIVKSKEKLKVLLALDIFEKYLDLVNTSQSTTASLMQRYAQQTSIEIHYHRVAWKCTSSSRLEGKASLEISRKMKGFVLDNYLEPEKIQLDVKTEEKKDEFFVIFQIFSLISPGNNHIRVFKCNTIFYLNPLQMIKA